MTTRLTSWCDGFVYDSAAISPVMPSAIPTVCWFSRIKDDFRNTARLFPRHLSYSVEPRGACVSTLDCRTRSYSSYILRYFELEPYVNTPINKLGAGGHRWYPDLAFNPCRLTWGEFVSLIRFLRSLHRTDVYLISFPLVTSVLFQIGIWV